jgi:hypothetical protein
VDESTDILRVLLHTKLPAEKDQNVLALSLDWGNRVVAGQVIDASHRLNVNSLVLQT